MAKISAKEHNSFLKRALGDGLITKKQFTSNLKGKGKLRNDFDKDGVPDINDCEPKNSKKHGIGTTFAIGAGASFVGSEVSKYVTKRRKIAKLKQSQEDKKYWK